MILQRIRIIVGDAGFEPGTFAPEVWCNSTGNEQSTTSPQFSKNCIIGIGTGKCSIFNGNYFMRYYFFFSGTYFRIFSKRVLENK